MAGPVHPVKRIPPALLINDAGYEAYAKGFGKFVAKPPKDDLR
jgi:hypothetical protein